MMVASIGTSTSMGTMSRPANLTLAAPSGDRVWDLAMIMQRSDGGGTYANPAPYFTSAHTLLASSMGTNRSGSIRMAISEKVDPITGYVNDVDFSRAGMIAVQIIGADIPNPVDAVAQVRSAGAEYSWTASYTAPAGTEEGDLLFFAFLSGNVTSSSNSPPTHSAGLTRIVQHQVGGTFCNLYYRVADADDVAGTITHSISHSGGGGLVGGRSIMLTNITVPLSLPLRRPVVGFIGWR